MDLRQEITELLIAKEFLRREIPLEQLHLHIVRECQVNDDQFLNEVTKAFYETSDRFIDIYQQIIKHISHVNLKHDVLFQATPTIRFHFPVELPEKMRTPNGQLITHHVDSMIGHPLEEINCWLPLTKCYGSNALSLGSLNTGIDILNRVGQEVEFDEVEYHRRGRTIFKDLMVSNEYARDAVMSDCQPVPMEYGHALLFDSRCLHATMENNEEQTRVSLDFRFIDVAKYKNLPHVYHSLGRTDRTFTRGGIYHQKSAWELQGKG